ncbi:hypothetical protein SAMN06309944_1618 [Micrococcales bacterium KH10]|nr:hypothetical protein SAMN06309944_1618 [Micrococcales bacterium KH10]
MSDVVESRTISGNPSILVRSIRWYQRKVSPYLGPRCRFYPTCSHYGLEAVERFGAFRGLVLTVWRLMRCNQFSRGGIDDVPETFRMSIHAYDKDDDK